MEESRERGPPLYPFLSLGLLSFRQFPLRTVLKEREAGYEEGEKIAYRVCSTCSVKAGWLARPSVRGSF